MLYKIRTTSNGYLVQLDGDTSSEYVFKATELFEMLEFIGKHLFGRKIKVTEN